MLNSIVLDVAAGLIFTFLSVSLATSVIVEALSSMTKWRSRTLLQGVKDLVNDPAFTGLARTLYGHALVNPRGPGSSSPKTNMPAYIDSRRFAEALMDAAGLTKAMASGASMPALQATVNANVPRVANAQINGLLVGSIQRARGDLDLAKQEIASWFDTGMDRLSGAYKRLSQVVSLGVALIICVSLNIDALHIARSLWVNPSLVANVKAAPDAQLGMDQLLKTFPVGWSGEVLHFPNLEAAGTPAKVAVLPPMASTLGEAVIGWLITALATLFGAPFWFDALQNLVRLKGAGPSPAEKADKKAAAA
jgi:pimeloyl-ACP methyl ester carboxylesterase